MYKTLIYGGEEYPDYEIDEHGNVYNKKTNRNLKNSVSVKGYLQVYLSMGKKGKVKAIRVHKAVAETFIPNPNNYPVVNHIDENKLNPDVSNLEWTTYQGNTNAHLKICSEKSKYFNNRKLTISDVNTIRAFRDHFSLREFAKMFGVTKTTISNVLNNEVYCNGF